MEHKRFFELLTELSQIYTVKAQDYSGDTPLKDIKEVSDLGIEPWIGVVVRMIHKFGRLKQLTKSGKVECKDETIRDTLMDIAGYSLITIMLLEEYETNKAKNKNKAD